MLNLILGTDYIFNTCRLQISQNEQKAKTHGLPQGENFHWAFTLHFWWWGDEVTTILQCRVGIIGSVTFWNRWYGLGDSYWEILLALADGGTKPLNHFIFLHIVLWGKFLQQTLGIIQFDEVAHPFFNFKLTSTLRCKTGHGICSGSTAICHNFLVGEGRHWGWCSAEAGGGWSPMTFRMEAVVEGLHCAVLTVLGSTLLGRASHQRGWLWYTSSHCMGSDTLFWDRLLQMTPDGCMVWRSHSRAPHAPHSTDRFRKHILECKLKHFRDRDRFTNCTQRLWKRM